MKRLFLIFVLILLLGCSAETPIDTADTAADTTETDTTAADAAENDTDATADTAADTTETDTTAADAAQTDTDATADTAADTTKAEDNETEEESDVKQVQIIALKFIPKDMIIKVGTTVRWFANDERGPHKLKVWYENVGVDTSPRLEKASGDTWEYTFDKAGDWRVTDAIFKTVAGLDAHITVTDDSAEDTTVEE